MQETETIMPISPVPKMLDDLKHVYGREQSMRGRVLISQAIKVLENYQYWLGKNVTESPNTQIGSIKGALVMQKVIPKRVQSCLWCGSKRVRKIAEFQEEGYNEYQCQPCKQKFFR